MTERKINGACVAAKDSPRFGCARKYECAIGVLTKQITPLACIISSDGFLCVAVSERWEYIVSTIQVSYPSLPKHSSFHFDYVIKGLASPLLRLARPRLVILKLSLRRFDNSKAWLY